jgi:two-component system phosphate regulon response regulator PhoB
VTYLETLLQDHGFDTLSAVDGIDGLAKVKQEHPDLVALDISMPRKSGIRMYREMREDPSTSSIPVVVVTAVTGYGGDPEVFHKFLGSRRNLPPPDAFVAKPIDRDDFIKIVSGLLGVTK